VLVRKADAAFVISNANSGKAGPDANISVSGRAIVKT